MAARKNLNHVDLVRSRIQSSQLVNALQNHSQGKNEMSATQIKAAEILLRKTIPDLKAIDLTGSIAVEGSWTVKLGA